jgi:hypothetical protein
MNSNELKGSGKAGIATIIATIAVPVAVVLIANMYSTEVSKNQISTRYIELAIGILKDKPNKESESIRNWAIDIINKKSDVKLSDKAKEELSKQPILEEIVKDPIAGRLKRVELYMNCNRNGGYDQYTKNCCDHLMAQDAVELKVCGKQ